jgi:hypothetical protein
MTVRQLIVKLSMFNGDHEVLVSVPNGVRPGDRLPPSIVGHVPEGPVVVTLTSLDNPDRLAT